MPKVSSPMGFTLFLPVTAYMQMGCSVYFNALVSSKSSRPAALGSSSPCSLCPPGNSSVSLSLYAYTGSICQSRQIEHIRRERFHRTLQLPSWSCSFLSYPVVFSLIEDKIIYWKIQRSFRIMQFTQLHLHDGPWPKSTEGGSSQRLLS